MIHNSKKLLTVSVATVFLFSIFYFLFTDVVSAAEPLSDLRKSVGGGATEITVPITKLSGAETEGSLEYTLVQLLKWLYTIFWVVAVGFIVWAAFTFLTASGDEEKVKDAKKRLLYAVIAAVIGLLSLGIGVIVENILGGK